MLSLSASKFAIIFNHQFTTKKTIFSFSIFKLSSQSNLLFFRGSRILAWKWKKKNQIKLLQMNCFKLQPEKSWKNPHCWESEISFPIKNIHQIIDACGDEDANLDEEKNLEWEILDSNQILEFFFKILEILFFLRFILNRALRKKKENRISIFNCSQLDLERFRGGQENDQYSHQNGNPWIRQTNQNSILAFFLMRIPQSSINHYHHPFWWKSSLKIVLNFSNLRSKGEIKLDCFGLLFDFHSLNSLDWFEERWLLLEKFQSLDRI